MGRGRDDTPPNGHEYTPVQDQGGTPPSCNDNSIKVQEQAGGGESPPQSGHEGAPIQENTQNHNIIGALRKEKERKLTPLGVELDCAPLFSNVDPTMIQIQEGKEGRLNNTPIIEPDCTPDRTPKPISDVVGGASEEGEGDVIPPPTPFSDVVGCGPESEPDENYHYAGSYVLLGARKDERDHEDDWEDDIPTNPSSYSSCNDYLKGDNKARETLSAPQAPGDLNLCINLGQESEPAMEHRNCPDLPAPTQNWAKPEIKVDIQGFQVEPDVTAPPKINKSRSLNLLAEAASREGEGEEKTLAHDNPNLQAILGRGGRLPEKSGGHDLRTEFKPDFLDADEMAPGSKTAPAKPEVANDFTGSDTGISSGSEGEEVGNAPGQFFQGHALAEPGHCASRVEGVDQVYAKNLYDLNSDVSDADDEESCGGAAAAHEMRDYDDYDSDISDEMSDYDDYDSEVDVFSCTDSEYEEKIPSDSDLKHEGGMLHLSDVVLCPKNNHTQNTIVSGPTAGCPARGPTPGPEPTPAADSPTQPAPVLSRRRTPRP